jgi:hypothetical protein
LLPALADIGTVSLLTNGVEPLVLDESFQPEIVGASWRFDLQPRRLTGWDNLGRRDERRYACGL